MEHLVRFLSAEGREGQHHAGSLEEAVAFVERLRNSEGAQQVTLYQLTEIEFQTYYKVNVGGQEISVPASSETATAAPAATPAASASSSATPAAAAPVAGAVPEAATPEMESAAANGRRLFSRG